MALDVKISWTDRLLMNLCLHQKLLNDDLFPTLHASQASVQEIGLVSLGDRSIAQAIAVMGNARERYAQA